MDKYDTQQYILSIVDLMNNNAYIHPFSSKETALPKEG